MIVFASLPPVVRAVLWMVGALCSFTAMAVAGRELSHTMSAFEILFFRSAVAFVIVLGLLAQSGWQQLRTQRFGLHLLRDGVHFGGQFCWFFGLSILPLATVFAMEFTAPIWSAILATSFLGEKMDRGRVIAIVLGFIGILVIVQPGASSFDPWALIVVVAAIGFAISNVCTKPLSRTNSPLAIIFYMNIIQAPLGLVPALFHWAPPELGQLHWIIIVGASGLSAHFCLTRALMLADAILILPIDYFRLPLAVIIGYLAYNESVGLTLLVGATVIFAGNFYSIYYEMHQPKPA